MLFYGLIFLGLLFGILLVMPVGAADVPVIIALLNAYGGLTGAAMGFMLINHIQIITGSLDGASGLILSLIMCRAMNRSVPKVLFGAFGKMEKDNAGTGKMAATARKPKQLSIDEAVQFFHAAQKVIIVPGYGMAVAQAHHAVKELADRLKSLGVRVKYAIHPVAGRMPGHMNVLLAEADVPYTDIFDMEHINAEFPDTDIALVVGANDVTNPAARHVKSSPIYGMPILDVDRAKKIIVCKRSTGPGFSRVENDLYLHENTWMLLGDARETLASLVWHMKQQSGTTTSFS
jgi:proton-translocating NAD(P)+ transhydrogenase subunit beta